MLAANASEANPPCACPAVRRIRLADFRSYRALGLETGSQLVALTGENGAGKTNLLEALSLLAPGRGLRRADMASCARIGGNGGFAISVELEGPFGETQLGTGLDPAAPGQRKYRLNRANAGSARAFADHVRIVWLTPAMDGLFTGAAGERRRFLDRLVLAVDADHATRTNALERALRNRNKLLETGTRSGAWLDAAEREIAEIGIAVAAARGETVSRLASLIESTRERETPFPWAQVNLTGEIDRLISEFPAVEAEDRYQALLRNSRNRDAAAGRTLIGPQASDLIVHHGPKGMPAGLASTGEQKALLTGLVLAHARLVSVMSGIMPVVLLDEIAAHFDPLRRAALYDELQSLQAQVWMTGADPDLFAELGERADLFRIANGQAERFTAA